MVYLLEEMLQEIDSCQAPEAQAKTQTELLLQGQESLKLLVEPRVMQRKGREIQR